MNRMQAIMESAHRHLVITLAAQLEVPETAIHMTLQEPVKMTVTMLIEAQRR